MRQLNITKIIHDTYVKETARFYKKQEDEERRKRQEEEDRRLQEAELAMQQEIARAEEEQRKKQEQAKKRKAIVGLRASRQQQFGKNKKRDWKSVGNSTSFVKTTTVVKDMMGMNSPSKKRQPAKDASPSKKRGPNAMPMR